MKPKAPLPNPDADPDTDSSDEIAATPTEDIVLHEAQKILTDYTSLLHGQPVVSQR